MKVLHWICQKIWKTQQWPQDWKRSVFLQIPKKGNAQECSNYCTIALISQANKVMLKILQARLQQYMNCELPNVEAGFRKGRGTRDQIANIHWIIKKAREFQKKIYFCFIDYAKAFDCVDHNKLWNILKEMGIPDHLTCFSRYLYAGQEARVTTGHGTIDWFQIGKGVRQGCILSPCLFNLYVEYIMRNAWPEEAQAGIKIAGRNINNLRYADDTTLMAESEEELSNFSWWKWKKRVKKLAYSLTFRKLRSWHLVPSVQFSSVTQSCRLFATPWAEACQVSCPSPTPGVFSISCTLVGDAIQPSHPLLSSSPPAFNLSQYEGLFKWVNSSHQVAKVLEFHLQHQSFQWISRADFL